MKKLDVIAFLLLVIGGLNWGLMGLFQFNLVDFVFGIGSSLGKIVYTLVGLSALYEIFSWKKIQQRWK